jgi:hypothetical protein
MLGRLSAKEAAPLISMELAYGDLDQSLRFVFQVITAVLTADEGPELDALLAEPGSTGHERFDGSVAVGVAWALDRRGIALIPAWTEQDPLDADWVVWPSRHQPTDFWAARVKEQTHPLFASRRIFIRERDLLWGIPQLSEALGEAIGQPRELLGVHGVGVLHLIEDGSDHIDVTLPAIPGCEQTAGVTRHVVVDEPFERLPLGAEFVHTSVWS